MRRGWLFWNGGGGGGEGKWIEEEAPERRMSRRSCNWPPFLLSS